MNSHADIQRRLSAYCGGDLGPAERVRIEAHLASCPACRAEVADLGTTLHLIRSTPQVEPPPWMTSRIMAHMREEKARKRGWLQLFWFPRHTAFPVKILALLVVCVSGYYLSRSVETELSQGTRQQLQEIPAQQAPVPTPAQPSTQAPARAEKQAQPAADRPQTVAPVAPAAPAPQPAPRRESLPAQAPEQPQPSAPPAPYAPPPPVFREQYGGKAEALKAAPRAESANRAQEAASEMKKKSSRSPDRMSDSAAPATAGRAASAPAALALPQAVVRLDVADPSAAPGMIRADVLRCGGSITEEQGPSGHRITVRIPAARQGELLERLQQLGRLVERPAPSPAGAALIEMVIQW